MIEDFKDKKRKSFWCNDSYKFMEFKYFSDYFMLIYKIIVKEMGNVDKETRIFSFNCVKNYLESVTNRYKNFVNMWGTYDTDKTSSTNLFADIDKKTNIFYGLNRMNYPDSFNDPSSVNEIQMENLVVLERNSDILQFSLLFLREPIEYSRDKYSRYFKALVLYKKSLNELIDPNKKLDKEELNLIDDKTQTLCQWPKVYKKLIEKVDTQNDYRLLKIAVEKSLFADCKDGVELAKKNLELFKNYEDLREVTINYSKTMQEIKFVQDYGWKNDKTFIGQTEDLEINMV